MTFAAYKATNTAAPRMPEVPKDWQPTVSSDGKTSHAVIPRAQAYEDGDDKERMLLVEAGFNPDQYMVLNLKYRKWMRYDQEWLHYYRFDIIPMAESAAALRDLTIGELAKVIRKPRALKSYAGASNDAFCLVASDWQIGKGEGDGSAGTILRVSDGIDMAVKRVKELRKIGRHMPHGAFIGTGDLLEGTCGFYSNQPYLIDMNDRTQGNTTFALLEYGIEELYPLFDTFTVGTTLDNHGQKRVEGKLVTDLADNKTAEVYDYVRRAFEKNGQYDIEWVVPNDETSILLELGGVPVGASHGDLFYGGGKMPQAKALEWWKGQDFGMQPLRGAKILLSGHFHHYSAIMHGSRTHFQMPALDPGSKWFKDSSGYDSPPGTFTVRFDSTLTYGWADQAVLL